MNTDYQAYLDALKAGDEIIFIARGARSWSNDRIEKLSVVRRTPAQVVCSVGGNEIRFKAQGGRRIGGDYFDVLPSPAAREEIEAFEEQLLLSRMRLRLRDTDTRSLSPDALKELNAVLDKHT